jgi:SRSO17 transposase
MQSEKRNIERMADVTPEFEYSKIQHFISESPWDARTVLDDIARHASPIFQDIKTKFRDEKVGLTIDESGIVKKGKKSVGASRQYCGTVGKKENCQNLVVAALSINKYYTPIDEELFLAKTWSEDDERMREAGVPEERRKKGHQTKPELAFEIIERQVDLGTDFDFIAADGLYGNDVKFLKKIDALGKLFVIDIHSDQRIYLEKPSYTPPPTKEGGRGRKATKNILNGTAIRVDSFMETLGESDWRLVKIRKGTKGWIKSDAYCLKTYTVDKDTEEIYERILLIRRTVMEDGSFEYKYILSNAKDGEFRLEELIRMQAQRYFVERTFQELKQDVGVDQYQVRGWLALHHHLSICLLVQLYILSERWYFKDEIPLLSSSDLRKIVIRTYATKYVDRDEVYRQMEKRHEVRRRDCKRNYKNE